ncbi:MAG: DUF3293 domain-containing protein [Burkholderiales bacterium]|nr:DUF3293 domain-containing protein [Burkholderiales bacterium]MDR4516452.1 DUF3293 domain-containing protein [Nitrosomonas sp.]
MDKSGLSADLISNYFRAIYRVGMGDDAFELYIDQYSEPMYQLMNARNVSNAAIITAYNPLSQIQSAEKNQTLHAKLVETLKRRSVTLIDSNNIDSLKAWPDEKSVCILGINLESTRSIGRKLKQNAVVWIDKDAIPRIVLLR